MGSMIVTFCDACGPDVAAEATAYRLAIGALERRVDLCDDHAKEYVVPLDVLMREYGVALDGTRPKQPREKKQRVRVEGDPHAKTRLDRLTDIPCPADGCSKVPAAVSTFRSHLGSVHNYSPLEASIALNDVATERFGPGAFPCEHVGCPVTSDTATGQAAHSRLHDRMEAAG